MNFGDEEEATKVPPEPTPEGGEPTAFLIVLEGITAGQVMQLDRPTCTIVEPIKPISVWPIAASPESTPSFG